MCWVLDQTDLIQLLHDHRWLDRWLPQEGGFLDQDARFVDAMNVIDATLADVHTQRTQEAAERARIEAELARIRERENASRRTRR